MCIYLGNSPRLTYINQEHVFPAGLGGKQKLDNDVVSDQANKLFSPLELKLMRHSLIAFERMMYGPGKRGSLKIDKASKSAVNVGLQDNGQPILCYTMAGISCNIPQIYVHEKTATISVPALGEDQSVEIGFQQLLGNLERFPKKFVLLESKHVTKNDMLIGYLDGKHYLATSDASPNISQIQEIITKVLAQFKMKTPEKGLHHAKQSHSLIEDSEIAQMYAKVAMNVLAFRKGKTYASHPSFDEIRQWIITGENSDKYFYLPKIQVEPFANIMRIFPEKAHWCILFCKDGLVNAIVCFYNRYIRSFTLGQIPDNLPFILDGFVCDWKQEKEYTLMEFIETLIQREPI